MDTPALFRPLRARPPASTKVRMSGPLSLRTRRTMAVSAHSARQSQFWPWMRLPLAERVGRIRAPVQPSPGSSSAAFFFSARALATTSVRALTITMSSNGTSAPAAMPRISSR
ncbi:hypothetical protein D3C71_1535470 [compost metagenome]